MGRKGIDISKWQGQPDFKKVKDSGIEFVILKCGGSDCGLYKDPQFERNYEQCKKYNIPVGCYYFVGKNFKTKSDGKADAKRMYNIIRGKKFEYPIVLDIETTNPKDKKEVTKASIEFCTYLEKKGYYVAIYGSDISVFQDRLDITKLTNYDKWVAKYSSSKPSYIKDYGMWQYSETGKVNGINGYVDLNVSYKDYPKIMKSNHKNGF